MPANTAGTPTIRFRTGIGSGMVVMATYNDCGLQCTLFYGDDYFY